MKEMLLLYISGEEMGTHKSQIARRCRVAESELELAIMLRSCLPQPDLLDLKPTSLTT